MSWDLFPHQRAVEGILTSGSAVLWHEMRLGKTRAVLNAFDLGWRQGGPNVLVVICPEIAKGVWAREAEEMGLGYPVFRCYGRSRERHKLKPGPEELWPEPFPRVLVCNWEIAQAWQGYLRGRRFVLCLDEPHDHATNPKTQQYIAVKDLSLLAEKVWLTTGTFYKKSALDIYWQLKMLGPKANPFQSWPPQRFGEQFCEKTWNAYAGRVVKNDAGEVQFYRTGLVMRQGGYDFKGLAPGAEEQLLGRLGGAIDKRLARDLPYVPYRVPVWLEEGKHPYDGKDAGLERARTELLPLKIDATVDYVLALPERPVVVVGFHREFVEKVAERLKGEVIYGGSGGRQDLLERFARGKVPVLCINIKSAGVAIDLARAGHLVFGEPDWDFVAMHQAEARIKGPRQIRKHVVYHYLLVAKSVDEYVWSVKLEKGKAIERLDRTGEALQHVSAV